MAGKDNTLCGEGEGEPPAIPAFHVYSPKSDGLPEARRDFSGRFPALWVFVLRTR
ncbi:hypothetical protein PYR71_14875 [Rhizobium sp. MC63]|uniref:Uncharacterized protein n=1 Tax=Rhizobium mulingense TaxID=3031128 RepID=A0ACC6MZ99_9HYPH|nr:MULTISPECIES: hypothetical protein [unclassified Rhizobium]MDF0697765.1 hypothetical protein [Rhizobium sp. MC63]MEA3518613.1 hypothetical protein [Rhizobium sp. MJ31]